jgi:hypothetical protein
MKNLFKSIAELVQSGPKITTEVQADVVAEITEETTAVAENDIIIVSETTEETNTAQAAVNVVELGNEPAVASVALLEGQVAVNAAELETLTADAAQWQAHKTELATLRSWKAAADQSTGIVDANAADADQATDQPKKKSYVQELAEQRSQTRKR